MFVDRASYPTESVVQVAMDSRARHTIQKVLYDMKMVLSLAIALAVVFSSGNAGMIIKHTPIRIGNLFNGSYMIISSACFTYFPLDSIRITLHFKCEFSLKAIEIPFKGFRIKANVFFFNFKDILDKLKAIRLLGKSKLNP